MDVVFSKTMWVHTCGSISWLTISKQGGQSMESVQRRAAIAKQLTPAQLAEAQRLSQRCQAQQFKGC
jgi:hypothetical protein